MGYLRRMSAAQGDRGIVIKQEGFLGGLNLDLPSSEIDATEVADAENVVFYRTHAESRSGWTPYGNLTSTKNYCTFFHQKQRKWVVVDAFGDVYVYDEAYETGSLVGSLGEGRPSVSEYGDWAVIFGYGDIYVIELDNSNYLRSLNKPNPSSALNISSTIGSGDYKYRYLYTYCRYVNDVLVAETGTVTIGDSDTNYTEVTMPTAISDNSDVIISMTVDPYVTSGYTHVHIYRTLDVGQNGINLGNNPNLYYLCSKLTLDEFGDYINKVGIGNLIIGSTFIISGDFINDGNNIGIPDDILRERGLLCKVLDYQPLPSDFGNIGDVGPGYLLMAIKDGSDYYYSPLGNRERAGYYNPAFQFGKVDGAITYVSASRDSFLILCRNRTYRLSAKLYQDVGDPDYGLSIPQLSPPTLLDDTLGTIFPNSIEKIDGSRVIGLLNDHSVRIWDGTSWGKDWGKFKIETELAKVKYAQGLFDPRGIYFLFYRYNSSAAVATNCLRCGLTEDVGIGWTKYTGSNYIWPLVYDSDDYLGKNCVNFTHSDGFARSIIVGDYDDGTGMGWIETYDASGLTRVYLDNGSYVGSKIQFKDYIGSDERLFISHAQTNLYLRPFDRVGSYPTGFAVQLYAYTDENSSFDSYYLSNYYGDSYGGYDRDIFFDDKVSGHKIRLVLYTTTLGFKLIGLSSMLSVQDRPILRNLSSQDQSYILSLTSDLLFRMGTKDPTINVAVANKKGSEIGSYVSTVGQAVVGSSGESSLIGQPTNTTKFSEQTYKNASYITFNGVY